MESPTRAKDTTDRFLLPWAGPVTATSDNGKRDGGAGQGAPAYITAKGRDLRVDVLRGYFVLAMIVDHIRGASPVQMFTGGNRFFTSAAEGFILTSGLMVGLVYHRIVTRDGIGAAAKKALARAAKLYLLTVGMTLILLPLSEAVGLPWAQEIDLSHSLNLVASVLTLHRTYYLADVMLLYTLLFAIAPVGLALMAGGKTRYLLGASWLLWALYQFFPDQVSVTWPIDGNLLFAFSAWQVLFFTGMVLGYQRDRIPSLTAAATRKLQVWTGVGFGVLIALYNILQMPAAALPARLAGLPAAATWVQEYVFGKADLRPGRIIASAVVFTFIFLTLTRQWRWIGRPLDRILGLFGRNSLYAFSAHVALVTLVALVLTPFGMASSGPHWLNALIQVGGVVALWLLTRNQVLEPTRRTQPIWQVSPVVLALVAVLILPWLSVRVSAASAPAPVATVSADVLARARAFGTPVARLQTKSTTAGSMPPPASTPAPAAGSAKVQGVAAAQPQPAATPAPPHPAAPPSSAGGSAVDTQPAPPATPAAGSVPAITSVLTDTRWIPKSPIPGSAAPSASGVQVAQAGTSAAATARAPAASGGLPALPPEDKRLQSGYVGTLVGHAYALTFHSAILNRDMPYWIYLPPDYGKTNKQYPVVYMLHGGGGTLDEWAAYGLVDAADKAFASGKLAPYLIVMPEGEKSFWANWAGDGPRWGDYLAHDVVAEIDTNFATIRTPQARGIGGLSMGAWGALSQGFLHPDIFGSVLATSPSIYPDDDYLAFLGTGAEFSAKDPVALAENAKIVSSLKIWLDIGQEDPWASVTLDLHNVMLHRGIQNEWNFFPGTHRGEYWAEHVPDYLQWFDQNLARQ